MISTMQGIVKRLDFCDQSITKLTLNIASKDYSCINYNYITGEVHIGDMLLVNTTAVDLRLGTGGFHFVICNLSSPVFNNISDGHIMKLKYTPMQINCMTAEAQESPYHNLFNEFESLHDMPVIVGTLHSMLAPWCIYLKHYKKNIRISYIMTDGGALGISISDIVKKLKQDGYIDATITYGNAFGGDIEAVNIYTALIAAKEIVKSDAVIVCMGPGIVGTDTKYGFSGIEQGGILDAVNKLGGYAIGIPRISFIDERKRQYGISHHSITVFKDICCTKINIPFPIIKNVFHMDYINKQINEANIKSQHNIYYVDSDDSYSLFADHSEMLNKMGRSFIEDPEFFLSCAAAAKLCLQKLNYMFRT